MDQFLKDYWAILCGIVSLAAIFGASRQTLNQVREMLNEVREFVRDHRKDHEGITEESVEIRTRLGTVEKSHAEDHERIRDLQIHAGLDHGSGKMRG